MMRFWIALMALLLALPAAAHQQKITITTIEHNPRTGLLEVIHRVPLHDAEHALRRQGDTSPDIIGDAESRSAFARYVTGRFSISLAGEAMELTVLGSEIEGGNLLVYQEAPSPGPGTELSVSSQILTDVWARQVNRVNLGKGTQVETLIFRGGDAPKTGMLR